MVDEESKECRYARNVSLFFSRARRDGADPEGWAVGFSSSKNWELVDGAGLKGELAAGAATVVLSLAGGVGISSWGCALRSWQSVNSGREDATD